MKTSFNRQQMQDIALKTRHFKKLYVTTEGVMFPVELDAIEATRTKNMIIGEAADHVGVATLTEDMMTAERLTMYAKNPAVFNRLFDDAKIPRSKESEKAVHQGRVREKPVQTAQTDADEVANIFNAESDEGKPVGKPVTKPQQPIVPKGGTQSGDIGASPVTEPQPVTEPPQTE